MRMPYKNFLVTGGAGFIGSAFIRFGLKHVPQCEKIINLDLLTYAADLGNLASVEGDERYVFVQGDIRDEALVEKLCVEHEIDAIVHFAAESHVDRSILGPRAFYETNVGGTLSLLEVVRRQRHIHFHHISTDEVYGTLAQDGLFNEESACRPNSPYSASKAAADHFVRAYAHTYGLSTTVSHCTNNYGPGQNVEKFIPRMIASCLHKQPLTLYGEGINVRDWIFVDDHSEAVWTILEKGEQGQIYDIGGECERRNIDLLHTIIQEYAALKNENLADLKALITFISDRPGHDLRYGIDCSKIKQELGWRPLHDLSSGLRKTIAWYLENLERLQLI
ncbi:MAG: dTDP-glucose 4,6-dehydratase [Candidatus Melainabacteria bacterium]|nr:dTDP-glucose 4,6-dehydratase [Candidatus Melainabacteria bacterium]